MRLMIPLDSLAKEFIEEFRLRRFAIEAEPVRHGRWIDRGEWVDCSECSTVGSPHWKRCPVCEAKMCGESEERTERLALEDVVDFDKQVKENNAAMQKVMDFITEEQNESCFG